MGRNAIREEGRIDAHRNIDFNVSATGSHEILSGEPTVVEQYEPTVF